MAQQQLATEKPGLFLSPLIAGMWRLADWDMDVKQRIKLIEHCISLGITSFDHADIYGNYQCEGLFGEALKAAPELREQMQIVTKCGIRLVSSARPEHKVKRYDTSYNHIVNSVENSLKSLNTDYLDCVLIHRPDPMMNAAEVAAAFSDLRAAGKIRHAGVSNFLPHQFELLQSRCAFPLATNQIEISVMQTQSFFDGSLDDCQTRNTIPMAWSPLAGGRLFSGEGEQALRLIPVLEKMAKQYDASIDQIAYAWLLKHPSGIRPIVGSGKNSRISNAAESLKLTMSSEQWFEILEASRGESVA